MFTEGFNFQKELELAKEKEAFEVLINYKSGKSISFWCYEFSIGGRHMDYICCGLIHPLIVNLDEIESAYQINYTPNYKGYIQSFIDSF